MFITSGYRSLSMQCVINITTVIAISIANPTELSLTAVKTGGEAMVGINLPTFRWHIIGKTVAIEFLSLLLQSISFFL